MRTALNSVRLDKISTTKVSSSSGIPTRTLRRYVNYSKNPNSIFFIEEPEEESDDEDSIVWKPQTAVPMFKIWTDCNANASASDCGVLISDVASTEDESGAVAGDISAAGDNISAAVDIISAATDAHFDDFVDIDVPAEDGLSIPQLCATNVFDDSNFDKLFEDFVSDDMFADHSMFADN